MDYQNNGRDLEIYFEKKTDSQTIEILKIYGWRWNKMKRCWRNKNTAENLQFVKLLQNKNEEIKSPTENLERVSISFEALLVRKNSFYCESHHHVKDFAGEINVVRKDGSIKSVIVPVAYCVECDIFFLLEETYIELKQQGIILCKVLSHKDYKDLMNKDNVLDACNWNSKSPLAMWGYSVNQKDDYSVFQRRAILEDLFDSGLMTRDRILSYLDWFISLHGKDKISSARWLEDREYIAQYKLVDSSIVKFH